MKLSDYLGASTDEILGLSKSEKIDNIDPANFPAKVLVPRPYPDPEDETSRIPILGAVRAGYDYYMDEDIEGWMNVDPRLTAVHPQAYTLRVKGDSMEPDIHHGDFVICFPDAEVRNGDTAIVCINGDIGTIKRVSFDDGGITLIPSNPKYKPTHYTPEDVESYPVTILAKVDEIRRKL